MRDSDNDQTDRELLSRRMARPWSAATPDGGVEWSGVLSGDEAAVARVLEVLDLPVGDVAVTPTGPFVQRDPSNELAVLAAILEAYGAAAAFSGDVPDLTFGAPPDAVF